MKIRSIIFEHGAMTADPLLEHKSVREHFPFQGCIIEDIITILSTMKGNLA